MPGKNGNGTTAQDLSLANSGGLAELDRFPDGYGADRGDGYYYFKGIDGQRYRQPTALGPQPPDVKDPKKDLKEHIAARVRVFDLSDKDDLRDYQRILNDCANGYAQHAESDKHYDPDTKNWRVFMRWYEFLLEPRRR